MQHFDIAEFVMIMTALLLGVTVHEWAHAFTADRLGDDTPRLQGRVTLWPPAHLDPFGTILMIVSTVLGFGIGWGKPVQTDPRKYTIDRRVGDSLVSFAGPLSNLVIATVFALLLRTHILPPDDAFTVWSKIIVLINATLFVFNLIPIYPLDGSPVTQSPFARPGASQTHGKGPGCRRAREKRPVTLADAAGGTTSAPADKARLNRWQRRRGTGPGRRKPQAKGLTAANGKKGPGQTGRRSP